MDKIFIGKKSVANTWSNPKAKQDILIMRLNVYDVEVNDGIGHDMLVRW